MKRNLTGAHLKWIAIVTMFIDHFAAIFIRDYAIANRIPLGFDLFVSRSNLETIYIVSRLIGRLAFPLFAFLLVEGFRHTRNVKNYLMRMGIFALISEIPFNLMTEGVLWTNRHQSIFVTLFLGLLLLYSYSQMELNSVKYKEIIFIVMTLLMGYLNENLNADYGFYGIVLIAVIYQLRNVPINQAIAMFFLGLYQMTACLSGGLAYLYNGKKGSHPNKYFFYFFYPVHILLIFGLSKLINKI